MVKGSSTGSWRKAQHERYAPKQGSAVGAKCQKDDGCHEVRPANHTKNHAVPNSVRRWSGDHVIMR